MELSANTGTINGGGPLQFDEWMAGVRTQFETVAQDPTKYPYSAPLAGAVLMNFETPRGEQLAHILHHANPERPAPEAYRLVRSGYVAQLLQREGAVFPTDYRTVQDCLQGIRWAQTTFPFGNRLNEIFREYDLSTTIWSRYATEKFLGQVMLHHNGGEGRKRGDIGCSDFTGSTAVLMSDIDPEFSFAGVEVLTKENGAWVACKQRGAIFDEIVSRQDTAGLTMGVDRVNPRRQLVRDFIEGSMTPEELQDGALPTGHQKLLHALHDGTFDDRLCFVEADVSKWRGIKAIMEAADGQLDESIMIVAWHQGGPRKRREKFDGMHTITRGPVIFVDFVRRDASAAKPYLSVCRQWAELNVIVSLPDAEEGRRLYTPMQWTDGRCRRVRFTRDLVTLAQGGAYEEMAKELVSAA